MKKTTATKVIKAEPAPLVDPKEYGLDEKQGIEVQSNFLPVITERENLEAEYKAVTAKEISKEVTQEARNLRLKLVKIRTNTDKIHKVAKAFYLAGGRFVDALKNKNVTVISQMEEKLESIENYYVNLEKERIAKLEAERTELVMRYSEVIPANLGTMDVTVFDNYLNGLKIAHQAKLDADKKAEEERIAKEKADAEERERIRVENERLKAEAEKREKELEAERKKAEAEKRKQEAELAKQKAEADARLKAEKEKQAKLEAELRAKEEAEKKAAAIEAARIKAQEEEQRKLARQPDKVKLESLAVEIFEYKFPDVKSEEAKKILANVQTLLNKVSTYINEQIKNL